MASYELKISRCVLIYIDRGLRTMNQDMAVPTELHDLRKKAVGDDVVDNLLNKEGEKRGNE